MTSIPRTMKNNPLPALMNPRSIAIAGAGNNPMKMGTFHALSILKDGYKGKLYPLHPREELVMGLKAYRSPADLPEAPDLAFMVVPAPQVVVLMEEFGRIGTRHAVIISAGFRETGGEGRELEKRLIETAEKYGMRFIGPNCMGIINTEISLNTTVMALTPGPGLLGMASQSGTYITQSLPYLENRGIRFSKAISVGNEANLGIIDALEYLGEDEQTKSIALYIEGIRDVPRFLETARAITPRKPVIAQYVGGSTAGARSGLSHTGALAGPDHLYDGMFRQAGIIRVHSVEDLYHQGWALAALPPLKGNRIGIITNSGGPGTAIANVLDGQGLQVPPFSEGLRESLKVHIPPHAPSGNPVDVTFDLDIKTLTRILTEKIMTSGEVDGIIIHGIMLSGYVKKTYPHIKDMLGGMSVEDLLKAMLKDLTEDISLPWRYGIPVTLSSFYGIEDNYTAQYQEGNVPVYDSPEKAARAMAALYRYREIKQRPHHEPAVLPTVSAVATSIIASALGKGQQVLDEHQSKMILASYGIPVTEETLAASQRDALAAAETLGYPVVLKACAHDIPHKTERGLVHLNCTGPVEVQDAYRRIQEAVPGIPVIVYTMVEGIREFIAGMTRHPAFGPCVLFGLGGIYAEALEDTALRVSPLSRYDAEAMTREIRGKALLGEFRKMPPVDMQALSSILQAVGVIGLLHREIAAIDLNPIIIEGDSPVVVDALMTLAKP